MESATSGDGLSALLTGDFKRVAVLQAGLNRARAAEASGRARRREKVRRGGKERRLREKEEGRRKWGKRVWEKEKDKGTVKEGSCPHSRCTRWT
jgi:hypothetical protein